MTVVYEPPSATHAPALQFERFAYRYPGGREQALIDLDLDIGGGEFVLVCGDSGSGKSTFLRAVSGLVPHHFGGGAEGAAMICGRDLRDHDAGALAAVCGTVFQDPESQRVMDSVRAEVAFPLENLGWEADRIALAVEETAAALGIDHMLDRRTDELSGGELQRVSLAAALATSPRVLVLDEPTSQLDPIAADDLLALLARINGDRGTTIVLAEHRIDRVLEHADRVLMFADGRLAIDAPPPEFLARAAGDPRNRHILPPPADLFRRLGRTPLPVSVKDARSALGLPADHRPERRSVAAADRRGEAVLALHGISHTYRDGAVAALSSIDLELHRHEAAVLLGANGSGKSTLLRIAHGVQRAGAGSVERAGEVALLLQNPNDYLIHERVADEAPVAALERFGLAGFEQRDPRDLSGGERQRLALAIVMQDRPPALLLDEPTRGMDAARKLALAARLRELAEAGVAVLVATHDIEFAARFASRAIVLGGGRLLADAPVAQVLGGGSHYSTAIARLLPGSGVLTAEEGARVLA